MVSKKAGTAIAFGALLTGLMIWLPFGMAETMPIDTRDCTICHLDMIGAHATVGDDCGICHQVVDMRAMTVETCVRCHVEPAEIMAIHGAGHARVACIACHPAHPPSPDHTLSCYACHGLIHGEALWNCAACHGRAHRLIVL